MRETLITFEARRASAAASETAQLLRDIQRRPRSLARVRVPGGPAGLRQDPACMRLILREGRPATAR